MPFALQFIEPSGATKTLQHASAVLTAAEAAELLGGEVQPLFLMERKQEVMLARLDRSQEILPDNFAARRIYMKGIVRGPVILVAAALWRKA